MGTQQSQRHADILFSEHYVSITLTQPGPLCLTVFCGPLSQQLFSITQICRHIPTSLHEVEYLRIRATQPSSRPCRSDREEWLTLIHAFRSTKRFHLAGDFSMNIPLSLTALPALTKLRIDEPGPRYGPLREAIVSLMVSRRLSGRLIDVEYERLEINEPGGICLTNAQRQYLTLTCF
jgi:hypothetical protein